MQTQSQKYNIVEFYDNVLCIEAAWLVDTGIISYDTIRNLIRSKKIEQKRIGGNGRSALIEYKSIPEPYRSKIIEKIGNPEKFEKYKFFKEYLQPDRKAIEYFANYRMQNGKILSVEKAKEYHTNLMFIVASDSVANDTKARRSAMGGSKAGIWQSISTIVNELQTEYNHSLPTHYLRLKDRVKSYKDGGLESLIHRNFGNQNSRKVVEMLENLILSIYIMKNKPYVSMVLDIYMEFLSGKIDIIDMSTGEVYNRNDFYYHSKGTYLTISEATVSNYINDPKNRAIVDSKRNDAHYFNGIHRPHHHRRIPDFSLSKISMDDRDLVQIMKDAKGSTLRVKAYYVYDVTSGALIGYAHSKSKDTELFIDCMRNMFQFLVRNNIGIPMEAEVEHHLVNQFESDMMKAGVLFPHVRWCNPGNSQEKRAEHFIKGKKYGFEKRYNDGVGRYHLTEANRPKQDKEWNENGMEIKEKAFTYERIVADDIHTINKYNNDLHPNQKLHKGMSRMQVLKSRLNRNLAEYKEEIISRFVGFKTETSIRRNQYCVAFNDKYMLPSVESLSRLKPNNYSVTAYYIPKENGEIDKVHLYQDIDYIATCDKLIRYNEATCEQTEDDRNAYLEQSKFVSGFDKMIRDGRTNKTTKLKIIEAAELLPEEKIQEYIPTAKEDVWNTDFEYDNNDAFDTL